MIIFIDVLIILADIFLIWYFDRLICVKKFYRAVFHYDIQYILKKYPEQHDYLMTKQLPHSSKLLLSFKKLRYEDFISMDLIRERILKR